MIGLVSLLGAFAETGSSETDICKHSWFVKRARACPLLYLRNGGSEPAILLHQIRNVRPNRLPHKHIAQFTHNSLDCAVVDIYIGAGEITGGSEYAVTFGVTNKPGMAARIDSAPAHSEAKLEWHIEARDARTISGDLHARQVVNRVATAMQKGLDAIKPPRGVGNFERCMRNQSKGSDAYDVGDIKPLKGIIVGNIQKDRVLTD